MGRVTFNEDLQIKATSSNGLSNIKTTSRATLNGLKLGDYDFPTCSATNHQIAWKELTLDGVKGDFLVCGEASSGNNNPKNCSEATNGAFPSGSYNPNGNDISGCYKETYVWMSCNDYRMCGDWMGGQAGADRRDYADGGDPQYIWDDYTGCYPLAYNVQSTTPNDSSCDEPGSHYGDYNMNGNCSGYSGEMYLQDAACKREGAICTACHESSRKVYVCGRSSHDTPETGYSSHQYEILDKYNTCKGYR